MLQAEYSPVCCFLDTFLCFGIKSFRPTDESPPSWSIRPPLVNSHPGKLTCLTTRFHTYSFWTWFNFTPGCRRALFDKLFDGSC